MKKSLKKILLIGTGGTITAKMVDGAWKPGEINEDELMNFIPEIQQLASIKTLNLFKIDSVGMQPKYWVKIAQTIKSNYKLFDGFVIIHGSDTMHYTASALSFLIQKLTKPVILTGAMVPPQEIGTDAKRNVIDSLRVATESRIHEVVIVFNGKIMRGNRTKKFRELEFDAYHSIGMSPLGLIEQSIRYTGEHYNSNQETETSTQMPLFFDNMEIEVCIQKITPGYNPEIIPKLIEIGYKGIITEGFGSGNVPIYENSLIDEIQSATQKGVPIIVCSQCAVGFSWMMIYEAGKKAMMAGSIPGYDMISETALTKLMWILGNFPKATIQEITDLFLTDVAGEISEIKNPEYKRVWE
ncbi:asparaginase [Candidatus Lokiarchaeum ossiferum]|uniref:asparaginase n=1 Tax=Candidatus Lokiarchaeum ossiferum TaxID=2951803 RepID=UPI00352F7827